MRWWLALLLLFLFCYSLYLIKKPDENELKKKRSEITSLVNKIQNMLIKINDLKKEGYTEEQSNDIQHIRGSLLTELYKANNVVNAHGNPELWNQYTAESHLNAMKNYTDDTNWLIKHANNIISSIQ